MEKAIQYKDGIDYEKTLGTLGAGDYVKVPTSANDISAIRTAVYKAAKKFPDASFTVNKTINGARITRNA